MPARITLQVIKGQLEQKEFVFDERMTCIIGRSQDCRPRLPNDELHRKISRHHCLIDINPPDARIRDFGSLNGTYVNGEKIGQRKKGLTAEQAGAERYAEYDLKNADEIRLGDTVFRVVVHVPARCAQCACEIDEANVESAQLGPGVYQCDTCRAAATTAAAAPMPEQPYPPTSMVLLCAQCGKDVTEEAGANRQGEYTCLSCQSEPQRILDRILAQAKSGHRELVAIQGYSIERELGRGGMGAVYLARRDGTQERVALKIMLPQIAADDVARGRFLREVETTRALKHPHVVELKDCGCSEGIFFFTLEYCDGGNVGQLMRARGGKLPIADAATIILQTLAGLDYSHHADVRVKLADGSFKDVKGVVHRDLTPQNILLSGSGTSRVAKVGDYGLAKAFDTAGLSGQTRTGTTAGKPLFMSRQQVINYRHQGVDQDVWAAAACFYNMLTGAYPRDFPEDRDVWQTLLQTNAVPIRNRDPQIPKPLAQVIDTALIDKPKIGFQTAAELKRALERVL